MENEHWFGEWVEYRNEEEAKEAREYLRLWIKFVSRKLPSNVELDKESILYSNTMNTDPLRRNMIYSVKFRVVGDIQQEYGWFNHDI